MGGLTPSERRHQVRENECDDINCMLDAPHAVHTEWQRGQIAKQQQARATAPSPSERRVSEAEQLEDIEHEYRMASIRGDSVLARVLARWRGDSDASIARAAMMGLGLPLTVEEVRALTAALALSEKRRRWIETFHAKRVGRCAECQRVCGMGQHADAGRHADDCSVPLLTTETPNG